MHCKYLLTASSRPWDLLMIKTALHLNKVQLARKVTIAFARLNTETLPAQSFSQQFSQRDLMRLKILSLTLFSDFSFSGL